MKNNISQKLLEWYDRHHRDLPWRVPPDALRRGIKPDPYRVWLSEIMLQQTTVEAVKKFYRAFTETWPNVAALGNADLEDVLKAWAGLGYYSRARNLKKAADIVAFELGGAFPQSAVALSALPGVGRYTSAAIASIAFNEPVAVVDGNVERVMTRLEAIKTPLPAAKAEVYSIVAQLLPKNRPGDFAQACMDLGATICTPRKPKCILCPIKDDCQALKIDDPQRYPFKLAKATKPQRKGAAFVAYSADGAVLLTKRLDKGLLAGMSCVPTTAWTAREDGELSIEAAPLIADWEMAGTVRHVFTHFELELIVYRAEIPTGSLMQNHWWSDPADLPHEALPTVFKKAIEIAIPDATRKVKP